VVGNRFGSSTSGVGGPVVFLSHHIAPTTAMLAASPTTGMPKYVVSTDR
jgi:hypothetical protein